MYFFISVNECKTRWKSLRDTYNRKKKNLKQGTGSSAGPSSRWEHYESMAFLDTVENERWTITNVSVPLAIDEESTDLSQPQETDVSLLLIGEDYGFSAEQNDQYEVRQQTSFPERTKKRKRNSDERFWESMEKRDRERTLLLEKLMVPEKDDNGVRSFFESMSQTVTSFPPELIAEAKAQICKIVTDLEIRSIRMKQASQHS